MSILLTSAGSDSKGKTGWEGGEPLGDNTGREFQTVAYDSAFYNVKETCVLRCTNSSIANAIRIRHKQMADNNCYGYDQSKRMSALSVLRKTKNYDPSLTTEKCACDCSSSVGACVVVTLESQGIKSNITGAETTSGMRAAYLKSGWFTDVTKTVNLSNGTGLLPGDILLRQGKHVVIVWEADTSYNKIPRYVAEVANCKTCSVYSESTGTKSFTAYPTLGVGNLVDICDETSSRYYVRIAGKHYGWVVKKYLKKVEVKPVQKTGKTTTLLNMRTLPNNPEGSIIRAIPAGVAVVITDKVNDTKVKGKTWYKVTYNGATGYCSTEFIKI